MRHASRRRGSIISIRALVVIGALSIAQGQTVPTGFQEYFALGNEEHVWRMFNLVAVGEGQPAFPPRMYSVIACAASADGQRIYFDQWEDGFEPNIQSPVQASTLILGDGNAANGDANAFTTDPRITSDTMLRGTSLTFNSDQAAGPTINQFVPMPRNPAELRFDGGDRVFSSGGPATFVHYQRPDTTFLGGSTEIISRQGVENAVSYSIPVGVNTYTRYGGDGSAGSPFKYVYLDLVAFDDDTQVFIDNKAGGTAAFTLQKGQHYSSNGFIETAAAPVVVIREGTKVSTTKPVLGLIFTGATGTYQTRFYTLLPDKMHAQDFILTAPGDNPGTNGSRPLNVYIYNPNPLAAINVTASDTVGTNTFTVPANSVVAYTEPGVMNRAVPANSTTRLTSNQNFWGISAYDHASNICDWGHSWLARRFLTPDYSMSWSPGTRDPVGAPKCSPAPCDSVNRSPIFIAATLDNTRITIDLNLDGVPDAVDTDSNDVPNPAPLPGNVYLLDALQTLRVYDHVDYDNTGTQVIASKPVAMAYGQDTDQGVTSDDTLDLGNAVFPLNQEWLDPVLTIDKTGTPLTVPTAGGTVRFRLEIDTYNFGPLTSVEVFDFLPVGASYVPGTTVITHPTSGTSTNDPVATPPTPPETRTRLDWAITPNTLQVNQTLVVEYDVNFPGGMPNGLHRNEGHARAILGAGSVFSAQDTHDTVKTDVTMNLSVAQATAPAGAVLDYTLAVTNGGANPETSVVITNPLPPDTTFVSACCGGVYDAGQNAIVWTIPSLGPGAGVVLTFQLQIGPLVPAGTIIPDTATYASAQTVDFPSNTVQTVVGGPILNVVKTGPSIAAAGDRLTYGLTISNSGTLAATNVLLVDPFPGSTAYVPGSMIYRLGTGVYQPLTDASGDDEGTAFANRVELALASLAPGASALLWFSVEIDPMFIAPGNVANQANYSATQWPPTDSNLVITEVLNPSQFTPPPVVDSPIYDTDTVITGTSISPPGTTIDVYVNGVFIGSTVVVAGGTWSLTGVSGLVEGDLVSATATEVGKPTSVLSNIVEVLHIGNFVPAPVVNDPVYEGETLITGTSVSPPGTLIDVFVEGVYIGTTVVNAAGGWSLEGAGPLVAGQAITATATEPGVGTSQPSNTVIVQPLPQIYKRSSANGLPVVPGQTVTYTMTITNFEAFPWTGITLTDTIDPNTNFVLGSTSITAPVSVSGDYRDLFNSQDFDGSDGSIAWADPWEEIGEGDGPAGGDVAVEQDLTPGDFSIRVSDDNNQARRAVPLAGYTSATLTFNRRRASLEAIDEYVAVEISSTGIGGPYTELARYTGPTNDAAYVAASFDITAHMSANTVIRFASPVGSMSGSDTVWFDDVRITATTRQVQTVPGCNAPTLVGAAGCNGFTLLPGEQMVVTCDVTVDNPLSPLIQQITNNATLTSIQHPGGTNASVTDQVDHGLPDMLRNDQVTDLTTYDPANIFVRMYPAAPSMDPYGFDGVATVGEGAGTPNPGSSDDDDYYARDVVPAWLDPDATVLGDDNRKLVFYELVCPTCVIHLQKSGSTIEFTW